MLDMCAVPRQASARLHGQRLRVTASPKPLPHFGQVQSPDHSPAVDWADSVLDWESSLPFPLSGSESNMRSCIAGFAPSPSWHTVGAPYVHTEVSERAVRV